MSPVTKLRGAALMLLPFALAAVSCTTLYVVLYDRLPDPVATHFGIGGAADGFTGRGAILWVALGFTVGLGVLFAVIVYMTAAPLRAQQTLVASGFAAAGLLGYLLTALLLANADAADATTVELSLVQLAAGLGTAVVAGALGWLLASLRAAPVPETGTDTRATDARRLPLAEGEAVAWSRVAASPVLPVLGAVLLSAGVVCALLDRWPAAVALLLAAALIFVFSGVQVTVDRRGVLLSLTLVPVLRRTIGLDRIQEAVSRPVSCLAEFGGWGYRVRPGKSGVVLRSGEALALRMVGGREFVVTVDDSATAAALLNTLVDRHRAAGEA